MLFPVFIVFCNGTVFKMSLFYVMWLLPYLKLLLYKQNSITKVDTKSDMFYVENGKIMRGFIDKRMTPNDLKKCFPNADCTFIENWNLHKNPRLCNKLLLVVKIYDNLKLAIVLCISMDGFVLLLVSKNNDIKIL